MAINIRKFVEGIGIVPKTTLSLNEKGELQVLNSSGKLNYHNGVDSSPVVTESHDAVLTNKTISSDDNTVDLELAALRVDLANADKILRRDVNGEVVAQNDILDNTPVVTEDATQTLTNKTITSPLGLTKDDVGLSNVDNTSDLDKPISTDVQTALDNRATTTLDNLQSPTAISVDILPVGSRNIGSLANRWNLIDATLMRTSEIAILAPHPISSTRGIIGPIFSGNSPNDTQYNVAIRSNGLEGVALVTDQNNNDNNSPTGNVLLASGKKTQNSGNSGIVEILTGDATLESGTMRLGTGDGTSASGSILLVTGSAPLRGSIELEASTVTLDSPVVVVSGNLVQGNGATQISDIGTLSPSAVNATSLSSVATYGALLGTTGTEITLNTSSIANLAVYTPFSPAVFGHYTLEISIYRSNLAAQWDHQIYRVGAYYNQEANLWAPIPTQTILVSTKLTPASFSVVGATGQLLMSIPPMPGTYASGKIRFGHVTRIYGN